MPEEMPTWAECPARRGQPGRTVRRTLAASALASAMLGGSASSWLGTPRAVTLAVALSGGALAATSCLSPHWLGVRRRIPYGNSVALTFDDGPSDVTTPAILDALADADTPATFFVLGEQAARFPRVIERIAAEGHAIGIHGWDHRPMTWERPSRVLDMLHRARDVVENRTGRGVSLYRPPWGHRGPALRMVLSRLHWEIIGWRFAAGDWRAPSPDAVVSRVEVAIRPRDIVLLHDAGPGAGMTAAALPTILKAISRRRLTLRTVE